MCQGQVRVFAAVAARAGFPPRQATGQGLPDLALGVEKTRGRPHRV